MAQRRRQQPISNIVAVNHLQRLRTTIQPERLVSGRTSGAVVPPVAGSQMTPRLRRPAMTPQDR